MTMPTDEERREVASRLRDYERLRTMFTESNVCAFSDALGAGYLDWEQICARLADLIEPEPERTCRKLPPFNSGDRYTLTAKYASGFEYSETLAYARCSECGTHFCVDFAYCPYCGAKVTR